MSSPIGVRKARNRRKDTGVNVEEERCFPCRRVSEALALRHRVLLDPPALWQELANLESVAPGLQRPASGRHVLQSWRTELLNTLGYFAALLRLLICGFSVRFRGGSP